MSKEYDVSGGWDVSGGKDVYDDLEGIARRKMKIFFLVDTSGSMSGSKIGAVNSTLEEMIPDIVRISEESAEADIDMAVLAFSDAARWITPSPVPVKDYKWNYLSAKGLTAFGAACQELDRKLSREAFMKDMVGNLAPVIILLSDGAPTDDYSGALEKLKTNNWFRQAIRVGIAIGNDADTEVLEQFTEDPASVVRTYNIAELQDWIRFVTITASKIGSTSRTGKKGIGDDISAKKGGSRPEEEDAPADRMPQGGGFGKSGDSWSFDDNGGSGDYGKTGSGETGRSGSSDGSGSSGDSWRFDDNGGSGDYGKPEPSVPGADTPDTPDAPADEDPWDLSDW